MEGGVILIGFYVVVAIYFVGEKIYDRDLCFATSALWRALYFHLYRIQGCSYIMGKPVNILHMPICSKTYK